MVEVTSDIIVRMRHLRAAKFCADGARKWWRVQGFDWSDFLTNGISATTLLETGDPMALRVVEIARNEDVE
jgi:hypothetical protein